MFSLCAAEDNASLIPYDQQAVDKFLFERVVQHNNDASIKGKTRTSNMHSLSIVVTAQYASSIDYDKSRLGAGGIDKILKQLDPKIDAHHSTAHFRCIMIDDI